MLEKDDRLKADGLTVHHRYAHDPAVFPSGDRLLATNIVAAFQAYGINMDKHRLSRMKYQTTRGRQYGVRTRSQAIDIANVLQAVYSIEINYKELL